MEDISLYDKIASFVNLLIAFKKARKGKTRKSYVIEFEKNLTKNLSELEFELKNQTYVPKPLKTFVLRDPKTRKISKSEFRDRIIHHALCNVIEPIFDKFFIYDSCANRKDKGTLFAIKRFDSFKRKVTNNLHSSAFCFKADIKHYFQDINRVVLIKIIKRKISDEKIIHLIKLILNNFEKDKGMPLGNLTSQFFANVYLHELDHFIKHKLKAKYYIRYVDDFIILFNSKEQLGIWKEQIREFLKEELKLELHSDKSRVINLSRGVDFVGFRNFYHFRLLRKRNIQRMEKKIILLNTNLIDRERFYEIIQGWDSYAKRTNSFRVRLDILNFLKQL